MIRTIYKTLVPLRLRERIYVQAASHFEEYIISQWRLKESGSRGPRPAMRLEARHIEQLQVVADREALLQVLPKNAVVAELGVNEGDFSQAILQYTQPKRLHLVDVWESDRYHEGLMEKVSQRFQEEVKAGQVVINRGYSTVELEKFDDAYLDWVYIDTNHTYETTAEELELCRRKVKPGGIIAGHDYTVGNWEGRVRYGVVEAVNEFCVKHDWQMIYLTHEADRHLSFAVQEATTR